MNGKIIHEANGAMLIDMDEKDYFADPCDTPSFSNTSCKHLLKKSPLHCWIYHPKLGGFKFEPTKDMQRGSILHALLLNKKIDIEVLNFPDYRKKEAQQLRDSAEERGAIPILEHEWDEIQELAEYVIDSLPAKGIEIAEHREVVGIWKEPTMFGDLTCRCRIDALDLQLAAILDIKTAEDANPIWLHKRVNEFSYDTQEAAYCSFLRALLPEMAGRESFTWLFIEELPEWQSTKAIVQEAKASGTMKEIGLRKWKRGCEAFAKCLHTNEWPAYTDHPGAVIVEPSQWQIKEELDRDASFPIE